MIVLLAVLQPCATMRLPLGAHRPGGQPWQVNALLCATSSWRVAVAFTGCTLLLARGILARRRVLELHRLAQASPVLKASQLSLPNPDEQRWEAWQAAGALLVARLRGSGDSPGWLGCVAPWHVDTLLHERVYQVYLPVFDWLKEMRRLTCERGRATLIGMQCLQGGGKTTICDCLELLARREGLNCVVASIDDFYKTHAELHALAQAHPDDVLLHGRGQPGTHDMVLLRGTLAQLRALPAGESMWVPRYDKSAHAGQGDRAPRSKWQRVTGPVDLVVLEGWCLGFRSTQQPRGTGPRCPPNMRNVDAYLAEFDETYAQLDAFVVVQAICAKYVYAWREQAERERRVRGEGAMDAEQVVKFVGRYYPSYEQYLPQLYVTSPCAEDRTLRYWIDENRRPCQGGPTGGATAVLQ